jgi:PAS domain S-box-containing protein
MAQPVAATNGDWARGAWAFDILSNPASSALADTTGMRYRWPAAQGRGPLGRWAKMTHPESCARWGMLGEGFSRLWDAAVGPLARFREDGRTALLYDTSERRDVQQRLRRMEAIGAVSADAVLSCSFAGTIETWSPACERLYGYNAPEMIGASIERLLPSGNLADLAPRLRGLLNGEPVSFESTEQRKDGALVEVAVTLSPLRDERGRVTSVVSVARDITERNRTAARLAHANARFAAAFDAASTGMAVVGPDGRFLEVNPALCTLLARGAETLLAGSLQDMAHPDDQHGGLQQMRRLASGEIVTFQLPTRYLLPDGGIVWVQLTLTTVREDEGGSAPRHFVAQLQDITARHTADGELQRYAAQLQSLADQDPLTGLGSRRCFETALETELSKLTAGGRPCSVLSITNEGGDAGLLDIVESVVRESRTTDLVAHLGAGQLAVLLVDVDSEAATAIAQRTRDALAEHGNISSAHATAARGDTVVDLMASLRERPAAPDRTPRASRREDVPTGIERLLELARHQLGMPLSFLARVDGDEQTFVRLAGPRGQFGIAEGDSIPFADTHCTRMLDGRIGSIVRDLATDPETRDLDVTTRLGLRAYVGVPVRLRSGEIYGTLCTVDTHTHPELGGREVELIGFLAKLAAELIDDAGEAQTARRVEAGVTGVRTLLVALQARDFYTGEHSVRVVALAQGVARRLGLEDDAARDVEQVALLHDIGKVGIPDALLQKQGPLDSQEWELMRQHPIVGERIIAGTPSLSHLSGAMRAEHERWDGTGYPDGLAGDEIPLASRITLACDALHAMTSDRPYRSAMTLQHARRELESCAGSQFDPRVTAALLAEIDATAGPAAVLPAA